MHTNNVIQDRNTAPLRFMAHATAQRFLAAAQSWLMQSEAEHNILLGFAVSVANTGRNLPPNALLATVHAGDDIAGCISLIPPYKLGLSRMPPEAVPVVLQHVAALHHELPGVVGPDPVAERFGAAWIAQRGGTMRCTRHHRIYECSRVIRPERAAPGRLRNATAEDLPVIQRWIHEFGVEVGLPDAGEARIAEDRIRSGTMFIWEDRGARCMASLTNPTQHGIRVTHVYTPAEWRGHGYAASCTAELTQRALDQGRTFTMLYTDMDNPTSNAIYQRIGYVPLGDVFDWTFLPTSA